MNPLLALVSLESIVVVQCAACVKRRADPGFMASHADQSLLQEDVCGQRKQSQRFGIQFNQYLALVIKVFHSPLYQVLTA